MAPRALSPGYSLLELLVVLAIMGLIAVVAVPVVAASLDRMTLMADARAVATELRALREAALDQQKEIALDAAALPVTSGTTVEAAPAEGLVVVAADGTTAARFRLARGGATVTIAVNRLTGRVSIQHAP